MRHPAGPPQFNAYLWKRAHKGDESDSDSGSSSGSFEKKKKKKDKTGKENEKRGRSRDRGRRHRRDRSSSESCDELFREASSSGSLVNKIQRVAQQKPGKLLDSGLRAMWTPEPTKEEARTLTP